MAARTKAPCVAGKRHWFVYPGEVGTSAPVCVRLGCSVRNPWYDPDRDPYKDAGHWRTRVGS